MIIEQVIPAHIVCLSVCSVWRLLGRWPYLPPLSPNPTQPPTLSRNWSLYKTRAAAVDRKL